ncbi:MAG: L-serine ammonia-lyase, iron-sulfur-dependent, subunit alpha [Eisenbergiella massiliensis]
MRAAAAMGAAAVTKCWAAHRAAFHAAAMALKNVLGLTCDPVAGLVKSAVKECLRGHECLLSADLALARWLFPLTRWWTPCMP